MVSLLSSLGEISSSTKCSFRHVFRTAVLLNSCKSCPHILKLSEPCALSLPIAEHSLCGLFRICCYALDIRCVSMPTAFETATVLSDASARSCCSKAAVQLMNKQAGLRKK